MTTRITRIAFPLLFLSALSVPAWSEDGDAFPQGVTFSTLVKTTLNIEGLTGDDQGILYTPGRALTTADECPVWRFDSNVPNPPAVTVGRLPAPCAPLGLALDNTGRLFVTEPNLGKIFSFVPNATTPPLAAEFATGVPGANGVAFDSEGNLWVSDGVTGQGRVWKIAPAGGAATEVFRVQPMA